MGAHVPKSGCNIPTPTWEGAVTQEPLGGTAGPALGGGWQEGEGQENLLRGHSETSSFLGAKSPRHTAIGGQWAECWSQQAPWGNQA